MPHLLSTIRNQIPLTAYAYRGEEECCNLCGSRHRLTVSRTDRRLKTLKTVACGQCGLIRTDPMPTDAELDAMYGTGMRGVRINLKAVDGKVSYAALDRMAERIAGRGWHIQLYFYADHMPQLDAHLVQLPVDVVIDHIGYVRASDGVSSAGFQMLQRLARSERAWFKLSAPYRQSTQGPFFDEVMPLVRALYALAPSRCVWGSDWPHASRNDTGILKVPNDGDLAEVLIRSFPDAGERKRILVDNPARLYGFD